MTDFFTLTRREPPPSSPRVDHAKYLSGIGYIHNTDTDLPQVPAEIFSARIPNLMDFMPRGACLFSSWQGAVAEKLPCLGIGGCTLGVRRPPIPRICLALAEDQSDSSENPPSQPVRAFGVSEPTHPAAKSRFPLPGLCGHGSTPPHPTISSAEEVNLCEPI